MAACAPILQEKIRAVVYVGSSVLAQTPAVLSFSVNKSREQVSNTFSVTLELHAAVSFAPGNMLSISAGVEGNLKKIMIGYIESTSAQPTFGKAGYFTVTLGGRGVLSKLENKKFSRRLSSTSGAVFCLITGGVVKHGTSAYNSLDKAANTGNHQLVLSHPNPARATGEQSPLTVFSDNGDNQSTGGVAERIAGKPSGDRGTGSGSDTRVHTHESLDEGGPAFAVYSVD